MSVDYWDDEQQPTPMQWRELGLAACKLLGVEAPKSRLAASEALVRLRLADHVREDGNAPDR